MDVLITPAMLSVTGEWHERTKTYRNPFLRLTQRAQPEHHIMYEEASWDDNVVVSIPIFWDEATGGHDAPYYWASLSKVKDPPGVPTGYGELRPPDDLLAYEFFYAKDRYGRFDQLASSIVLPMPKDPGEGDVWTTYYCQYGFGWQAKEWDRNRGEKKPEKPIQPPPPPPPPWPTSFPQFRRPSGGLELCYRSTIEISWDSDALAGDPDKTLAIGVGADSRGDYEIILSNKPFTEEEAKRRVEEQRYDEYLESWVQLMWTTKAERIADLAAMCGF